MASFIIKPKDDDHLKLQNDAGSEVLEIKNDDQSAYFAEDVDVTGNVVIGADADGTDRTITFGHTTLKSVIGIDDSGDVLALNTDNAFEAVNDLQIDASGNVTAGNGDVKIETGNLIIGSADKGIDFSQSQTPASGMTAEILDSYEEGVCTLAMAAGTSGTITLSTALETGSYCKIGNLVTVQGEVYVAEVSSPSGPVGHLTLTGLPFTCKSGSEREMRAVPSVRTEALTADINAVVGMIVDGTTAINLYRFDGQTCQADLAGNIQAVTALTFSITYRTT